MELDFVEYVVQLAVGFQEHVHPAMGSTTDLNVKERRVKILADPPLRLLLSQTSYTLRDLRLAMAPLEQAIPPVTALLSGEKRSVEAFTSVLYSLAAFSRFLTVKRDCDEGLAGAIMELHTSHWAGHISWCRFTLTIVPYLPTRGRTLLMSLVSHFIQACLKCRAPLVAFPETAVLCVELWVSKDESGQSFFLDNPTRTDRSLCPILDVTRMCIKDDAARRVFLQCIESQGYHFEAAKHIVDRLVALVRWPQDSGTLWPNLSWVCRITSALFQIGHPLAHEEGCLSSYMTRFGYYKRLIHVLQKLTLWGYEVVRGSFQRRESIPDQSNIPRFAFQMCYELVWCLMAGGTKRLPHLVQVVSGGALNVLLSQFDPNNLIAPCRILMDEGVHAATLVLLNSPYRPVSMAIAFARKHFPPLAHGSIAQHSARGKWLITLYSRLAGFRYQPLRLSRERSPAIALCSNLSCTRHDAVQEALSSQVCSACHSVIYCSRQCQVEDWVAFHLQECHARLKTYQRSKRNQDYQMNMRYLTHLGEYLEALCNMAFVDTAMEADMPCGIFEADMRNLPIGFRMVSAEEFKARVTSRRAGAYLNECSGRPESVKFACGMFLWGARMSVNILARLRYEEDMSPKGHTFQLLSMTVWLSTLRDGPCYHETCSSSCFQA